MVGVAGGEPVGGVGGAGTSEAEEQAAIDTGQIRAGGIRYAATRA